MESDFRKLICVKEELEENPEEDVTEPANLNGNRRSVARRHVTGCH